MQERRRSARRSLSGDGRGPAGADRRDRGVGGGAGEERPECRCRHRVAFPGGERKDDRRPRPGPFRAADRAPEDRAPILAKQLDPGGAPPVERLPEFADPDPELPPVERDLDDPAEFSILIDRGAPAPLDVAGPL